MAEFALGIWFFPCLLILMADLLPYSKFQAFLIVLFTSWLGYLWLWAQMK